MTDSMPVAPAAPGLTPAALAPPSPAGASAPPNSAPRPVQNPLTLVMAIRSADDAAQLHALLHQIQNAPPGHNPVSRALDTLQTVHFARFVFMENETRLAVITTYDGTFESYINEFIDQIGDVFNALLAHIAGAPTLPVQQHRQEFLDYVRANDLRGLEPFYSAYPTATVLDIRAALGQ